MEFYISQKGKDANPGTRKKPFASLARAQRAVREKIADGLNEDVTVFIREGTYFLPESLVFAPEDSGNEKYSVTWAAFPGERVILSGGIEVSKWKKNKNNKNLWQAQMPNAKDENWRPRQIYVNGVRAIRARTPNPDETPPFIQIENAELNENLDLYTIKISPDKMENLQNTDDIEIMIRGNWEINRKRIKEIDRNTGVVTLSPPHVEPLEWNAPKTDRWCFFENAPEFLDAPGEWRLDRQTGVITYLPRAGEKKKKAEVIVPRLKHLLELRGAPENPIRNLHFRGIRFEHAQWEMPEAGYMGIQACHFYSRDKSGNKIWDRIDAAIQWNHVESSSITDGAIAHTGGVGIALISGCRNNVIEGNRIFDISGNGIMLGGPHDEPGAPKDNRIANNHIHDCGVDLMGAVGVWVGLAQRTCISHNLIHDLPYSGISVGWQWNPEPSVCKENIIEYNHIHDVMKELADGGGIYTLGFQPESVIRGNLIHDVHRSPYAQAAPNNGIFIDEGSKGFLFEKNVIYKTAAEPVRFNRSQSDWHTWKDNSFLTEPPYPEDSGIADLEPRYRSPE
ncbi:right-handed parallel beta-helix repeat-containing protein [Candidatus Sumerlaeota bacterium]|nr:right-handed parallel beta-helix repeat-containing protein [Candidatus Sumerlaeota bacterium]